MTRLGGADANFLYLETAETPMHVAGYTLFDLPEGYQGSFHENYREMVRSRLHLVPIFSKKLAPTLLDIHHPSWVDAPEVDFSYHFKHITLPSPGSLAQLEELVARLHAEPLDRSRPLWQFTTIDGIETGQVALYSKVHHAAVDGGAGMVITNTMYDITPEPRQVKPPSAAAATPARPQDPIGDLVQSMVRFQLDMWRAAPDVMSSVANMFFPKVAKGAPLTEYLPKSPVSDAGQLLAPKTPFNVTITRERSYATRSLPLADAKAIAKASGGKLNDVVMAICSGALRQYLLRRNALPDSQLVAFVPISLRELGNTDLNNQVFGMMCGLATHIADPVARLKAIQAASADAKQMAAGFKDAMPQDYAFFGAPFLVRGFMELYGKSGLADVLPMAANVCISNVPGPNVPLYGAGAKVAALYPVSIPAHGCALNLTVQSYLGHLDFGLTADRKAVPDIRNMANDLDAAFAELKGAFPAAAPTAAGVSGATRRVTQPPPSV
ncbi:MAG TPA: wax ester/triacylglycerol synthase family O-acyltransferase [Vineibacter sp.]|nr:wax ester/triacylglycerol synthase family O-acyltransferase [Vineibacter sp.]